MMVQDSSEPGAQDTEQRECEQGKRRTWYVYLREPQTWTEAIAVVTATDLRDATDKALDLWSEHYHITGLTDDTPYEYTWAAQYDD